MRDCFLRSAHLYKYSAPRILPILRSAQVGITQSLVRDSPALRASWLLRSAHVLNTVAGCARSSFERTPGNTRSAGLKQSSHSVRNKIRDPALRASWPGDRAVSCARLAPAPPAHLSQITQSLVRDFVLASWRNNLCPALRATPIRRTSFDLTAVSLVSPSPRPLGETLSGPLGRNFRAGTRFPLLLLNRNRPIFN